MNLYGMPSMTCETEEERYFVTGRYTLVLR